MSVPPATAITRPRRTYQIATLAPKILIRSTKLPKSTMGEEMRKEKVTPKGNPALVKPMKRGIEEQEQKGVTVPNRAATMFAPIP